MNEDGSVAAGIDTHKDTHALCVIDLVGRVVRTGTYNADATGYDEIAAAIGKPEDCAVVGIEGTDSKGREIEMVRASTMDGWLIYHANSPLSKRTRDEVERARRR